MQKRWILASTLLLSSCAIVHNTSRGAALILKPQFQAGSYATKTVIPPYTEASIQHLILKLYTYDGTEHDQGIQKNLLNAQLNNPITFSNLKANITYRIKAFAYASADESALISTTDSNSYTEVTLTNDDRPTIANLQVKLIDRDFNAQATASGIIVSSGSYTLAGPETMQFINQGNVSTFVGGGGSNTSGYADDQGTAALFRYPIAEALDGAGNLYVADMTNNLIRKVTSSGLVSTLAGGGGGIASGYANGQGTAAMLNYPVGVAVDGSGNVYVADQNNHCIRKITSGGLVSTFAGGQGGTIYGYADAQGTAALFKSPSGLAIDGAGNLYVGDAGNHIIRKITSGGLVSTFVGGQGGTIAGNVDGQGTEALFKSTPGIAVDGLGNLFVTDQGNQVVRKVTSGGLVSTIAGGQGGTISGYANGQGTAALFKSLYGIAVDVLGNLYIADQGNHCIRKITSDGLVSTLAGGQGGTISGYANGQGTAALFKNPLGVVVDRSGNLYVGDNGNKLIRLVR